MKRIFRAALLQSVSMQAFLTNSLEYFEQSDALHKMAKSQYIL